MAKLPSPPVGSAQQQQSRGMVKVAFCYLTTGGTIVRRRCKGWRLHGEGWSGEIRQGSPGRGKPQLGTGQDQWGQAVLPAWSQNGSQTPQGNAPCPWAALLSTPQAELPISSTHGSTAGRRESLPALPQPFQCEEAPQSFCDAV